MKISHHWFTAHTFIPLRKVEPCPTREKRQLDGFMTLSVLGNGTPTLGSDHGAILEQNFGLLDTNHDGKLSKHELRGLPDLCRL